ncbi:hypothetical protein [Truepera radiovictrix]|uniref:Uncharacterized protein n=1 Tax=Truepera radiovictrix (strain DSM 17093 / CIP 108686 / LMG 22925 / RQ-24) TaxID=649638 RepID=D7CQK6_TRURR|nr:hypothetical protein [Truepera radiovictrix]ADI14990.1 conserved hypothetical protein [Truepera radiovictrix DSM 17093]WMT56455.1 hypothetical protein RCV51_10630 [Truepera radiovictrix]
MDARRDVRSSCPLSQRELIDTYFMEHRNQVLAIAAFLDRMDRSRTKDAQDEFRFVALQRALRELTSGEFGRTERVQLLLSDLDTSLLEERDQQGAYGAPKRQGVTP